MLLQVEGRTLGILIPSDEPQKVLEPHLGLCRPHEHLLIGGATGAHTLAPHHLVCPSHRLELAVWRDVGLDRRVGRLPPQVVEVPTPRG